MSSHTSSYEKFSLIVEEVAIGIWKAIREAKGNCVSFTPRRLVEYAGEKNNVKPIKLTLIKYVLDELVKKGVLQKCDNNRYRICKYVVCEDEKISEDLKNPLWELCKTSNPEEVIKILKQIVE